jgi:hypothetical protein
MEHINEIGVPLAKHQDVMLLFVRVTIPNVSRAGKKAINTGG